ncbi:MAG: RluA family pseudouridine synthase [Prolixibacteraceae bacterium]|nr:RluA family pseudouridine synthase [Prolixibacteraceae bacterium]
MRKSQSGRLRKGKPDSLYVVKEPIELMKFLQDFIPNKSRNNLKSLLSYSQIEVNGTTRTRFNYPLKPGDQVTVKWERSPVMATKSFRGFSIVYEDSHLIVIDKHHGILSVATDKEKENTAYSFLRTHVKRVDPSNKIFIVHRLDRETSGLMVFAKSPEVQAMFQDHWKEVLTERSYVAIVEGIVEKEEGTVESYLHENKAMVVYSDQNPERGKKAVTKYKVLQRKGDYSLLQLWLDTGRKNQIRVHMQQLGHPVVNDKKYGAVSNPINRLGLHSKILEFRHPVTGNPLRFETPLPRKFSLLF